MKKVLLLAPMSSVHERFNIANINVLRKMNCELHIAANFELDEHTQKYERELQQDQIITHHIPFKRSSLKKNLKCITAMKELFKREQFDMVHCHTETGGILTRMSMKACKKTKYVYTPHGMSFYNGSSLKSQLVYKTIEKWICNAMHANLAMNKEEYQVLCKWNKETACFIHGIGVQLDTIQRIHVDRENKRKEFGIPEDATLLLSVGELNENKNHSTILNALNHMKERPENVYYMICGEGMLRDELIEQAKENNMDGQLILPGYRYDIAEIFNIADVFVFPSYHEGLSVALMQAMAAGLPIVCSNIRGNVDLIHEGEGGFLCASNDSKGFAKYIQTLFANEDLRVQMGKYNLIEVKKYAIENVEQETEVIYRGVLE